MDSFARVGVIGLGYIGLRTAAVFAETGMGVGNPHAAADMVLAIHHLDRAES